MAEKFLRDYGSYLVLALLFFGIGFYSGAHLYNHGDGAYRVGEQIGAAIEANREHQAGAERIKNGVDRVADRIVQAQNGIGAAEAAAGNTEQLIGECQQILAGVRARGSTNPAPH